MELWIRSQDKRKLVKSSYLTLFLIDTTWVIYTDTTTGEPFDIGQYKTEKRALEVLDEIQNILKPKTIIKFDSKLKHSEDGTVNDVLIPREEVDVIQLSTYIYEMPQE